MKIYHKYKNLDLYHRQIHLGRDKVFTLGDGSYTLYKLVCSSLFGQYLQQLFRVYDQLHFPYITFVSHTLPRLLLLLMSGLSWKYVCVRSLQHSVVIIQRHSIRSYHWQGLAVGSHMTVSDRSLQLVGACCDGGEEL